MTVQLEALVLHMTYTFPESARCMKKNYTDMLKKKKNHNSDISIILKNTEQ